MRFASAERFRACFPYAGSSSSFLLTGTSCRVSLSSFQTEGPFPPFRAQCPNDMDPDRLPQNQKSTRMNQRLLAAAALFAAGGLWFALSAWRTSATPQSSEGRGLETSSATPQPRQIQTLHEPGGSVDSDPRTNDSRSDPRLRPPEPNRRFMDFTPEQRVEFARKGHGPGG